MLNLKSNEKETQQHLTETLVGKGVAELAKAANFDIHVHAWFGLQETSGESLTATDNHNTSTSFISRPTQSLLAKWLREIHGICAYAVPFKDHAADANDSITWNAITSHSKFPSIIKPWYDSYEAAL